MNTTEYQQSKVKFVQKVFEATETSLESFSFEKNLQCPELVKMVMLNMGLDQSNVKEIDPYVRMYLKDHPSYVSSRGRNGGIMPRSKKSSKQQNKSARAAAKEEAKEIVNAMVQSRMTSNTEVLSSDLDDDCDDIDFPVGD